MDIAFTRNKIRRQEYDLSVHAHRERQEEQITIEEIEQVLLKDGIIIEKYTNDLRGESCLIAGKVTSEALHVICGRRLDRVLIVTVYRPKPPVWITYKKRTKELKSRV